MATGTIALLGAGNVGTTIGTGLDKHGHRVVLASREPNGDKVRAWVDEMGEEASSASYDDAIAAADCVFFCVPGRAIEETLAAIDTAALEGRVVVDVTNDTAVTADGALTLKRGLEDSAAQIIQRTAPGARVVKAFNTTGVHSMVEPKVQCGPPSMPICGDDAAAKETVGEIVREFGWEPVDLGGVDTAPVLEATLLPWLLYGRATGRWDHCLKFVTP